MIVLVTVTATLIALLVVRSWHLEQSAQISALKTSLEDLSRKAERLDAIAEAVAEIEERTASPLEKARRNFDRGHALTPTLLRRLSSGDVIKIVEKSYHYPHRDPFIFEFDFELGSVGETPDEKRNLPVTGRFRVAHSQPWDPYQFTVGPEGAITHDCAGDIRGVVESGMDDPLEAALEADA